MLLFNKSVGECIHCAAKAYYNEGESRLSFHKPAPGCLCEIDHPVLIVSMYNHANDTIILEESFDCDFDGQTDLRHQIHEMLSDLFHNKPNETSLRIFKTGKN